MQLHDQALRPLIVRMWVAREGKFKWCVVPRYISGWTGTTSTPRRWMALAQAHCDRMNHDQPHA